MYEGVPCECDAGVAAVGRSASLNRFGSQTNPGAGRDAAASSGTARASHGKKVPAPSQPVVVSDGSDFWAACATARPVSGRSAERTRRRTALRAGPTATAGATLAAAPAEARPDVRAGSAAATGGSSPAVSGFLTSSASSSAVMTVSATAR